MDRTLSTERLLSKLLSFFGPLALTLACIGLYGVMSYAVACRTREIGIRMSLGARQHDMLRMVLQESMTLVGAGLLLGVPAAMAATRVVEKFLFGLKATDPVTIMAAAVAMLTVAAAAGYLPARRATRVDPMTALRHE